jgi:hypothetical protein
MVKLTIKDRCMEVALTNTPANVRYVQIWKGLRGGFACTHGPEEMTRARAGNVMAVMGKGCLAAPRPFTRKALAIFLHECAHFALHAAENEDRPPPVKEAEAYRWAFARMREAGIPVPKTMITRARRYIARVTTRTQRIEQLRNVLPMRGKEPLKWNVNLMPDGYFAEASTLKWDYQVMPDINIEGHWVAHRSFAGHLKDSSLGELWKDTHKTFESALARADRWHAERDGDHDWEWVDAGLVTRT